MYQVFLNKSTGCVYVFVSFNNAAKVHTNTKVFTETPRGGKTNILYSKSMQRQILLARELKEMSELANKESLVELAVAGATIALISNGDSFKLFRLIKLRRSGLRPPDRPGQRRRRKLLETRATLQLIFLHIQLVA